MRINLLQRISSVVGLFNRVKGLGNTRPLLSLLDKDPDLRMLVTSRAVFDKKYWRQLVTITDLSQKSYENRATVVDHYVLTELLVGACKLIEAQSEEIMALRHGEICTDPSSQSYSPLARYMKVRFGGKYIPNVLYANVSAKCVTAYRTNANGKPVLVDGVPQILTFIGEPVEIYFTLP